MSPFHAALLVHLPAFALSAFATVPTHLVRPILDNASGPNAGGGVILCQGLIAPGTSGPSSNGKFLSEARYGHPFADTQFLSPSADFARRILFGPDDGGGVYGALYPAGYRREGVTDGRVGIAGSPAAFRYKWLIYGPDPDDTSGAPPIINLFEQTFQDTDDASNEWFNDTDRETVKAQIAVLRDALAVAPLNRELQLALLDIHYDLATAEMQFARKRLAKLATLRLGLETATTPFIINDEIDLHESLVEVFGKALSCYMDLLSHPSGGVRSGDLDPAFAGAPFGYYLFANRVPSRGQVEADLAYATEEGVEQILDPGTTPVFAAYKDYRTLLTILGQYMQYQTDLARLLAMRRGAGDLTRARGILSEVQGPLASTVSLLRGMFPSIDWNDPATEDTGVRGGFELVRAALNDSVNVRGFVNGTSNILGLDPNFLLLVPTKPNADPPVFDTYDILAAKLNEWSGSTPVGPLAVALDELGDPDDPAGGGGAIQAYVDFRESIDQVATELSGLEDDFAGRFVEITGYDWNDGINGWDGIHPNSTAPGELATIERTITSLRTQSQTLGQLTLRLLDDVRTANDAVTIAEGIDDTITGAQASYLGETSSAWTEIQTWAGLAAGTQAATDLAYNLAGVDGIAAAFSGGANLATIAIAGAVNIGVQTAAATRTSIREQELDEAAIGFETKLALAELPLTVQQAKLEVGALMREAYGNRLEIEDNLTALAQAIADKQNLLREVERLENNLEGDRSALASRYYADPIHYLRAESALIDADAAFRRAQRWIFFTVRALEYKWQERFRYANPVSGKSFDIGTIFMCRNAAELEELVQSMAFFNQDREVSPGTLRDDRVTISLRDHVLTPNPDDVNREFGAFPPDEGLRYHEETGVVVSTVEHFRNILRGLQTAPGPGGGVNGPIRITFDTSKLEIGQFFGGPDYTDPENIQSGLYRDKIDWLAVHFVFETGSVVKGNPVPDIPGNNGIDGSMSYAGNTYFRTRVPPCPNRSPGVVSASEGTIADSNNPTQVQVRLDFPGEFVIAPFRYYQDTNFSGVFDLYDQQNAPALEYLFSTRSAEVPEVEDKIESQTGFQIRDFKERSVAATRWTLNIGSNPFAIDDLIDIELVIQHQAYTRPQITCP